MQHHQYSMACPNTGSPRHSSSHATSSAFSASANPSEDWTKISDLAERRRIQNRIAQRNYRKKIKRRLEDLEKRASSSSPEHTYREISPSQRADETKDFSISRSPAHRTRASPEVVATPYPFTPAIKPELSPESYPRELSISPPPVFSHSYSLPNPNIQAGYIQEPHIQTSSAPYTSYSTTSTYLQSPSVTLPSMTSSLPYQPVKPGCYYGNDDIFPQYQMNGFTPFTSTELPMHNCYSDPNAHVNHPEYIFHF